MQLDTSYKRIWAISAPIMLGSAVQNIIVLSDNAFMRQKSEIDFAAIGYVGVFYLIIAAIGFGFSRAGQLMIARRMGEGKPDRVGRIFYSMLYFELALAVVMFLFMNFGCQYFFALFINSSEIYNLALEYIKYRSWGVFFSYTGVAFVALYTGVARTGFIVVTTLILATVNIVLDYCLIFGKWGLPEMGIGGAGLASTIAEAVAFCFFVAYIFTDKEARNYQLFRLPDIDFDLIKRQLKIASPIVAQAIVGLGSALLFFGIVDNLGNREIAITNLIRNVYLFLSIPTWGFCSGINTMVSNLMGQNKREQVMPLTWKTAKLTLGVTMLISAPIILFPEIVLYPIFGSSDLSNFDDLSLITDAKPIFWVLGIIMIVFSISGVYFNALIGTGAIWFSLKMQVLCVMLYVGYIYGIVEYTNAGLPWAWSAEIFYWIAMLILSYIFLNTEKWHGNKI